MKKFDYKIEDVPTEEFSEENPLIIQRVVKHEDGGVDVTLSLNPMQAYVLFEFAIMNLVANGFAKLIDAAAAAKAAPDDSPEAGPAEATVEQLH